MTSGGAGPAGAFLRFAEEECRGTCRFYEGLSRGIASDPEVLALTAGALQGVRLPNLLFGSVRYLLLRGAEHPLQRHYERAAAEGPEADGAPAWPAFREFCLERAAEIEALVRTRLVQTNEVGRQAALLPGLSLLAGRDPGRPLGLVEPGCSAGLLLYPDRVRCAYALPGGGSVERGAAGAPVAIRSESRGRAAAELPSHPVRVGARIGIDRAPVDLRDPDALLWLHALVWPDRPEREERLAAAAAVVRADPPDLRRGDAAALLPAAIAAVPAGCLPVVLHSAAWALFTEETRRGVEEALAAASRVRPLALVAFESTRGRTGELEIAEWRDGTPHVLHRARGDLHGFWVEWSR